MIYFFCVFFTVFGLKSLSVLQMNSSSEWRRVGLYHFFFVCFCLFFFFSILAISQLKKHLKYPSRKKREEKNEREYFKMAALKIQILLAAVFQLIQRIVWRQAVNLIVEDASETGQTRPKSIQHPADGRHKGGNFRTFSKMIKFFFLNKN